MYMLFKRTPFSAPRAEQVPDIPSHERIDELYGFMESADRKRLQEIADTPRSGVYSGEEIVEINTIRARFEAKLSQQEKSFTSAEINALFQTLVGSVEKPAFDTEKFNTFQKHLGQSYLDEIERIKNGVRQGGVSAADQVAIRHMKDSLVAQIAEKNLPFLKADVDTFIDELIKVEPTPIEEIPSVPTFRADRLTMSDVGMDTLAGADLTQLRPEVVRSTPVVSAGVPRPGADLAPLSELGDADREVLKNLGVSLGEPDIPRIVPPAETPGLILETADDGDDFIEGFKARLEEEGLLQEVPEQNQRPSAT
jgi:hypothetical protein